MEAFRKVFDLNFIGTLIPSMVFTRDMIERKRGVILNISSMNSYRPLTRIPAYSAAKASINNFTAWLAVHLARQNIRVNAIAPGVTRTEFSQPLIDNPQILKGLMSNTPLARIAEPEEMVGTVVYLASDASSYVTGQIIAIDGGITI